MADIQISALPTASALSGAEVVPIDQAGTTKRTTTAAIAALVPAPTFAQVTSKPTTLAGYGITDAASSAQGSLASTAVQPGSLATVATTGAYSDLSDKPAIPTNNNQLTNGAGYVTTDTTYSVATTSVDGLMSAVDKTKLDGLGGGGNYTLPVASDTALGGVKIGANVTIAGGVISVAAPITDNAGLTNGAGYLTQHQSLAGYALTSQLFSGSYTDLANKPSIPAAQVNSDWSAASGVSQILNKPTLGTAAATDATAYATSAQGTKADSAVQPASLATVATSGAYGDLSGVPTIPVLTGATAIAVVASLPGTPDPNTLYFVTT